MNFGGTGGNTYKYLTEEQKKECSLKKSISMKGKNVGKVLTEKVKKSISETLTGRKLKDNTIEKMKNRWRDKSYKKSMKAKISEGLKNKYKKSPSKKRRKIDQLDLNGNLIKTWEYLRQASKVYGSGISACCNNKRKTSHGYKWKWHE